MGAGAGAVVLGVGALPSGAWGLRGAASSLSGGGGRVSALRCVSAAAVE